MSSLRNQLLCVDAVRGMRALHSSSIPLTVSSPPYDETRAYGGHLWDHESFALVAHELWRVTKPGGVVCWVVRDQIVRGSMTGTSFRQAIFLRGLGFSLDCIVYAKTKGWRRPEKRRYAEQVTPCYVFAKGTPRAFRPIVDRPNSTAGKAIYYSRRSHAGGLVNLAKARVTPAVGVRGNVWEYAVGHRSTAEEDYVFEHPALMPERLARDLIVSWSRPGDLVLDCFGGAGTTAKMSLLNDRRYLSLEVHEPYHELAVRRLTDAHRANDERLDRLLAAQQ